MSNSATGRSPTSDRQGRSWVAACRIHSALPMASESGVRSSKAIGSIRAIPAPSRLTWIR
ncbi:hypothetical protein ASE01_07555 [Nocardioides sp. Root190]|nr:hypothetical protein ASE01_07555 [Nocardioides sp. Root190]